MQQISVNQLIRMWPYLVGAVVLTSAVWYFFLTRELSVRDKQIEFLREAGGQQLVSPDVIRRIDENIAKLSLATSIDPINGRVLVGTGASMPSKVTMLLIEIEQLVQGKQYDLIDAKLAEIDDLHPDFAGSLLVRHQIAALRGYAADAERHANALIQILPDDRRILPALLYVADRALERKEGERAERLVLSAIALDPENKELASRFEQIFGYPPSPR